MNVHTLGLKPSWNYQNPFFSRVGVHSSLRAYRKSRIGEFKAGVLLEGLGFDLGATHPAPEVVEGCSTIENCKGDLI